MRKCNFAIWMIVFLAAVAAGPTMRNTARSDPAPAANDQLYKHLDLFGDVLEHVRSQYVDRPNDKKLIESAISGMVNSLDPHSSYLSPAELSDMQVETRGEFGGLGIEVSMEDGAIKIVSLMENTPAKKAGLRVGDHITHLNGKDIRGLPLVKAVERMRGPVKTAVALTIERAGRTRSEGFSRRRAHQPGAVQRRGRRGVYPNQEL
jgi:carboxyl-terminal processing protease